MVTRWILAVTLSSAAVGCTEATRPSSAVATRPNGAGSSSPGAQVASTAKPAASRMPPWPPWPPWTGPLPNFKAWTEPAAVDALVRGAPLPDEVTDPRGCGFDVPQQACVPGSEALTWMCKSDCSRTCDGCADGCRTAMATCRGACSPTDAACSQTCGATTGACVQSCLTARDRCSTGDCARRLADYLQELRQNYGCTEKREALDICKRLVACSKGCDATKPEGEKRDACHASCIRTRAPGCNAHFVEMVGLSYGPGNCSAFESGF